MATDKKPCPACGNMINPYGFLKHLNYFVDKEKDKTEQPHRNYLVNKYRKLGK